MWTLSYYKHISLRDKEIAPINNPYFCHKTFYVGNWVRSYCSVCWRHAAIDRNEKFDVIYSRDVIAHARLPTTAEEIKIFAWFSTNSAARRAAHSPENYDLKLRTNEREIHGLQLVRNDFHGAPQAPAVIAFRLIYFFKGFSPILFSFTAVCIYAGWDRITSVPTGNCCVAIKTWYKLSAK